MAPPLDRRDFLRSATLAATVPLVSSLPAWQATGAPGMFATGGETGLGLPAPAAWTVQPFPLKDVTLGGDGAFAAKRRLVLDHGRGYDVDRLLQVFRANAGLSTRDAVAPGGW